VTGRAILVLNAGSSSIKFRLFAEEDEGLAARIDGSIAGLYTAPAFVAHSREGAVLGERHWGEGVELGHERALAHVLDFVGDRLAGLELAAVGHRVVHGGPHNSQPVRVTPEVLASLEQLVGLAPLHQPHNLAPIRLLLERRPGLPQVACFDTAFHATDPDVARRFALPGELHEAGVRRYGFHGLSYEYVASRLPEIDPRAATGRTVVCHLGNGSSMCALEGGKSIASTMGLTALDGLVMGTRCGSLDPGVLLWLMDERGMDARRIETLLYQQSGLLGLSGISSDMRKLLASRDPLAKLAIDVYVYRIRRELGSLAAALGGLDALVFTAGVGENSALIRERVCRDAAWLGVELDPEANRSGGPRISIQGSRAAAWVVPTDEELMIARHARRLVGSAPGTAGL
jgi:acetate kinase